MKAFDSNLDIQVCELWNSYDVMDLCRKEGWYNVGTTRDYIAMTEYVDGTDPNPISLYCVADDILRHTVTDDDPTVTEIMFLIDRHCISRHYTVVEQ